MPGVFETLRAIHFGLNIEIEANLSQIIKDLVQHIEVFGLQSVGDHKTLKILHLHFRMIPMCVENRLGRNRIEGSVTSFKA